MRLDEFGTGCRLHMEPTRHWVVDGFSEPLRAEDIPSADAPGWEAVYNSPGERGKRSTRHLNIVPGATAVWNKLTCPKFLYAISSKLGYAVIPDPTIRGGGIHVMEEGGEIAGHIDADRHAELKDFRRAATVVVYLSAAWGTNDGGEFTFLHTDGTVFKLIEPLPGRMLLFENEKAALHSVQRVERGMRVSFMMPYLQAAKHHHIHTKPLFLPLRFGG